MPEANPNKAEIDILTAKLARLKDEEKAFEENASAHNPENVKTGATEAKRQRIQANQREISDRLAQLKPSK